MEQHKTFKSGVFVIIQISVGQSTLSGKFTHDKCQSKQEITLCKTLSEFETKRIIPICVSDQRKRERLRISIKKFNQLPCERRTI